MPTHGGIEQAEAIEAHLQPLFQGERCGLLAQCDLNLATAWLDSPGGDDAGTRLVARISGDSPSSTGPRPG